MNTNQPQHHTTMNTTATTAPAVEAHQQGAALSTTEEERANLISEELGIAPDEEAGAPAEMRISFWKTQAQEWKAKAKQENAEKNEALLRLDVMRNKADGKSYDLDKATAEIQELRKQLQEANEAAQAKEAQRQAARPRWEEYQPQSHAEATLIARLKWNKTPMPTAEEAQTMCAILDEIFWDFEENTRELADATEIATNITRALAIIRGEEVLRAALDAVKIPDYIRERGTRALDLARQTALEICEVVDDRENLTNLSAFFDVLKAIKGGEKRG